MNPHCPHCNKVLGPIPKRKKKCAHCGEDVYVRTLPYTRERVLVRQDQLEGIERLWQKYKIERLDKPQGGALVGFFEVGDCPPREWVTGVKVIGGKGDQS